LIVEPGVDTVGPVKRETTVRDAYVLLVEVAQAADVSLCGGKAAGLVMLQPPA